MSRHLWYFNLSVGWYRMSVAERGFLSTLYSTGMAFAGSWADFDALFGTGWKPLADGLAAKRVIALSNPAFDRFEAKIVVRKRRTS